MGVQATFIVVEQTAKSQEASTSFSLSRVRTVEINKAQKREKFHSRNELSSYQ